MKIFKEDLQHFEEETREQYPDELNTLLNELYLGGTYEFNDTVPVPFGFITKLIAHFKLPDEDKSLTLNVDYLESVNMNNIEISTEFLEKHGLQIAIKEQVENEVTSGVVTYIKSLEDLKRNFEEIDSLVVNNKFDTLANMFMKLKEELNIRKKDMRYVEKAIIEMVDDEVNFMELRIENISRNVLKRIQMWLLDNGVITKQYKLNCNNGNCMYFSTKEFDSNTNKKLHSLLNYTSNFDNFYDIIYKNEKINIEKELEEILDIITPCLDCQHEIDFEYLVKQYKDNDGDLFDIGYYKFNNFKGDN